MKALYKEYRDEAVILVVYTREAHPARDNQNAENAGWKAIEDTVFYQPKTFAERRKLAETACTFWDLPIPTLVDTLQPCIGRVYQALPNRFYLIDKNGRIAYRGIRGPWGCDVHKGEKAVRNLLELSEERLVTTPMRRGAPSGGGRRDRARTAQ